MRSFLIFIALVVSCAKENTLVTIAFVTSEGKTPYLDLRQPVYMVADKSLWSGCEKNLTEYEACRALRVKNIYSGISQWFEYFDKANHPRAVIAFSLEELPLNRKNSVIHLRIEEGNCGKGKLERNNAACYRREKPEIVFDNPEQITPRIMAHEFGHALGRDDNDVPEETGSVMSYNKPTNVLPLDIEMMCRLHQECRMEKRKR